VIGTSSSRVGINALIGLAGFAIGFLAYLASPSLTAALREIIPAVMLDKAVAFAMVSGALGSLISVSLVSVWAKRA
jgi:hypothetical protein